jgi:hypothetical protein
MEQKDKDTKKPLLLRLSPSLWRDLAAWAEDDFRSINGQIEFLLTECVRKHKGQAEDPQAKSDANSDKEENDQ